jgi:hypothetical protein
MVRVAICLLLLVLVPSALAEKRIALLIGNKDYESRVGALLNPRNDVRVEGDLLKAIGFEMPKPAQNARWADKLIAIHEFASSRRIGRRWGSYITLGTEFHWRNENASKMYYRALFRRHCWFLGGFSRCPVRS